MLASRIRLDDDTEVELLKIDSVHSVVPIGLHERDMQYYKAKYNAETYGMKSREFKEMIDLGKPFKGTYDCDLNTGELPPVPGMRVVHFPYLLSSMKECVFVIGDKVMLTCDSFQFHEPSRGFRCKGKVIIGPIWMKTILTMLGDGG